MLVWKHAIDTHLPEYESDETFAFTHLGAIPNISQPFVNNYLLDLDPGYRIPFFEESILADFEFELSLIAFRLPGIFVSWPVILSRIGCRSGRSVLDILSVGYLTSSACCGGLSPLPTAYYCPKVPIPFSLAPKGQVGFSPTDKRLRSRLHGFGRSPAASLLLAGAFLRDH